ncbi:cation diffusion facilitator family transporter [Microbacterium invictum]|uniref:Cation diffusion facilitator family transporter n=1 Tax=Microbacterium invictum TaxID=515415 RepID=A0ABZ0VE13_9MICO|nr:cation diffusion facilitator family transporter [Microbacterium invictum]WQB71847.1 cation diffusion facilitator family transporter [Microbacterium invictum]
MHDHPEPAGGWRSASSRRLLAISLAITASVMVVQVVGAILSGSLALIADAAHMFTDAAGLVIALLAAVVAARPATDRRTYGYQRAEVFGALANGVILIVLAAWVGFEAVTRLLDSAEVEVAGGVMLVVAVIGLVANGAAMWLLSVAQRTNLNVRGAYLEVLGDLLGSIAVIIAAIVILVTGWAPADAIASLAIAAMIVPRAVALLREVASVLSEAAPRGMEVRDIRAHILGTAGVVDVHDVHVWQLTRGAPVFSAHVVVAPEVIAEGRSDAVLRDLQGCLSEHFDVAHSTFQVEGAGHVEHDAHA